MKTTLAAIRQAGPCAEGWEKLCKSLGSTKTFGMLTEFDVAHIIESHGLDDALWVLAHACGKDGETICHLFACDVAERVLYIFEEKYPDDKRPREAIEAKRKWVYGKISDEDLDAARAAARTAAWAAARATGAAEHKWQTAHLIEMLENTK